MPERLSFRERQAHVSRLHDLTEHVAAGAITKDQFIFVGTVALAEMFGYEPQELVRDMTINQLMNAPGHKELVANAIKNAAPNEKRAMLGVEGKRKDGTTFRVSVELEFNVFIDGEECVSFVVVRRSDD